MNFLNFKDKSRIPHTYREKKLWEEKNFVKEDFSEETASIRKGLLQKAKDLRLQNKLAKIVHDKSIMRKREEMIFLKHKAILKRLRFKLTVEI